MTRARHEGTTKLSDTEAAGEKRYWVPLHVRACVTSTGAVILDLKKNRYFGLGSTEIGALASLAENWGEVSTQERAFSPSSSVELSRGIAPALMKAGLLTDQAPLDRGFPPTRAPSDQPFSSVGLEMERRSALRVRHVLAFARACLWARRAVRSRLLYSIAREIEALKLRNDSAIDVDRVVELVCLFRRLRPYAFAAKDQCLFHALALWKFLLANGIAVTWVVAVRPRPWAAHSWLQLGELVLDCNPEEIVGYTPILSV